MIVTINNKQIQVKDGDILENVIKKIKEKIL